MADVGKTDAKRAALKPRLVLAGAAALALCLLTWLWRQTISLDADAHARVQASLRELRSLDRTINQDVLRARYKLIENYEPVLKAYRRIEQLEAVLAAPPPYLSEAERRQLASAVQSYEAEVTGKQRSIEAFKYRSADLKELLAYLPSAGANVAADAAAAGEEQLANDVNNIIQQTLFYNLTSDESYAPIIVARLQALGQRAEHLPAPQLRRRVLALILNQRRLLRVKPEVDRLLAQIFAAPVIRHEERVAALYNEGYAQAESARNRYRLVLYGLCVALLLGVLIVMIRLRRAAAALATVNAELEQRVAARTRELDARNLELRVVLDNVDQALFTVDLEGKLSRERSAALARFLPEATAGELFWKALRPVDPETADWLEIGFSQLRCGELPTSAVLDQLPAKSRIGDRHYALDYRCIGDPETPDRLLVIMTDVTERLLQAQLQVEQTEQLTLFQHLGSDRAGLLEFLAEGSKLLQQISATSEASDSNEVLRALHTLKGNALLFGVSSVASVCHELETKLINSGEPLRASDVARAEFAWSGLTRRVARLTGVVPKESVVFSQRDFERLQQRVTAGASAAELSELLWLQTQEAAEDRFASIAEQAKAIALRLGKGAPEIKLNPGDVRFDSKRWAPFWAAFVHALRNALDHGIESAEERLRLGKPASGQLELSATKTASGIVIELSDDGRGIDWAAVRSKAQALNLIVAGGEELSSVLFRGGVSTAAAVTAYSGRGAGVSACYAACRQLGGEVTVTSQRGRGTTFRFSIPHASGRARSIPPTLVGESESGPPSRKTA